MAQTEQEKRQKKPFFLKFLFKIMIVMLEKLMQLVGDKSCALEKHHSIATF